MSKVNHTIHFGEKSFKVNEFLYGYFNKVKDKPELYKQLFEILDGGLQEIVREECIDFGLHLENLPEINKMTVHPPAGSGSGTGIYYKTIEQLYNDYNK